MGVFKGSCTKCNETPSCWYHTNHSDWFCKKCAKEINIKENTSTCKPFLRISNLGIKPKCDEDRFNTKTHTIIIDRCVQVGPVEWMIYYHTKYKDDLFETAEVLHNWIIEYNCKMYEPFDLNF